ncbi:DUF1716 domain protein [Pseudovirgaria hyperparasitica]|uniref:DUF1716 domain protein n=1 Tax=Pseudovirgaria hyperparasitica TaxID=470096 RepID=A0A6A6VV44_9PEZI|nr:DUF1716 domain protein [Pseudovirgaria hyperparasitica]KAF2753137.1 DUF1716 domain protein [Pseudovirgaria hyperparasitica]
MTSIDDLFKKPNAPGKRKIEPLTDPEKVYKSAKISANSDAKQPRASSVEDDDGEEAGPQLPPESEEEDYGPDDEEGRFFGSGLDEGTKDAMDYLDEQDGEETFIPEKIDSSWLKKTALNFEKRIAKNAELRGKYEEEPQKFMGSESDLDDDIKALSILSEHSELYAEFAKLGSAAKLVSLLSHENTDIAIDAIEIISELTDEDVEAEQEQWDALVDGLMEADILDLLTQNFDRFDETNDSDRSGVYHALGVIEHLISRPKMAETIGETTKLLPWLVSRIQVKEARLGQNKQYAAEILSIILQSSDSTRKRFLELDGVDTLLTILAAYRKRDPQKDSEEEEYVENLFDALTCVVDEPEGKAKFVEAEGVELCLIMLKEGKMSKARALTVLDHALADRTDTSGDVCQKLVEAEGLKRIFSLFMKKNDSSTNEHLLGIFSSLLKSLPGSSAQRIRTLAKFMEKDYEKISKTIVLRRDYATRLAAVDQRIKREQTNLDLADREAMEDEWFSRRLDAGLFCLQTVDVILAWLVAEDDGAKKKIQELLAKRNETLADVKRTIQGQIDQIHVSDRAEEGALKDMLQTLLSFL